MIYYGKTLFSSGPKLTAVQSHHRFLEMYFNEPANFREGLSMKINTTQATSIERAIEIKRTIS